MRAMPAARLTDVGTDAAAGAFPPGVVMLSTISVTQSGSDRFTDPNATSHTPGAWPGSNTTLDRTFTSTIFRLHIGNGTLKGLVAHLSFNWTVAGGRILSSLAYSGGLANKGGIAGQGGGLAN